MCPRILSSRGVSVYCVKESKAFGTEENAAPTACEQSTSIVKVPQHRSTCDNLPSNVGVPERSTYLNIKAADQSQSQTVIITPSNILWRKAVTLVTRALTSTQAILCSCEEQAILSPQKNVGLGLQRNHGYRAKGRVTSTATCTS